MKSFLIPQDDYFVTIWVPAWMEEFMLLAMRQGQFKVKVRKQITEDETIIEAEIVDTVIQLPKGV